MKSFAVTDEALHPSEFGIGRLFWTIRDAAIVGEASSGQIVLWNPAAERLFGWSAGEAVGQLLEFIIPERLQEQHRAGLRRYVTGGRGPVIDALVPVELHALCRSGEEITIELTLTPLDAPAGKDGHFVLAIVREVTDRKLFEDTLRRVTREQALILNSAAEGIYGLDAQGVTTFANPAAARMAGYDLDALVGRALHPLIHHTKPDGTPHPIDQCPIMAAIRDGQVHHVAEDVFWRSDGTSIPVEYVSSPIVDQGTVQGAVVVFHDISERKHAESARAQLAEEQEARIAAEAAIAARDEFLSVAAHELKTPMTSLRAVAQLALRRLERQGDLHPAQMERALRSIDSQAAKLGRLTNQLLDVSRTRAGTLRLEREMVDLIPLLKHAVETAQATTERHHIRLDAPPSEIIPLDPLRFEQVLTNLLENAVKYSPHGGDIAVTLETTPPCQAGPAPGTEGWVTLSVRDHGIGIPTEDQGRIFTRFYQAHSTPHAPGMGLGLYISKHVVELHGGTIDVETPPGAGTRFVIRLPKRDAR
jgi:PAS domain S-box-containing protein